MIQYTITIKEIRERIAKIEASTDDEFQHREEDRLFVDVLRAIAEGEVDFPEKTAMEALKVLSIDFERWYA